MIGSLFSGIGGLEMGLESLGLGPVAWQCDSDPYARAVLATHWPNVKRYEDVKEIDERTQRVEIICGGFPCQDISNAGGRAGIHGPRSGLWFEFARVVRVLRPRVVFVENVAALASRGLSTVLGSLAELGFDAEWGVFSAEDVGAPHRRRRMFVLAHAHGTGLAIGSLKSAWPELPAAERSYPPADPWSTEPDVGRVAHGVPARAHRLRLLGNACVPLQAAHAFESLAQRITQ